MSGPNTDGTATIPPIAGNLDQGKVKTTKASRVTSLCVGLLLCTNLAIVVLLGLLFGKISKIYSLLDDGPVKALIINARDPISVSVANANPISVSVPSPVSVADLDPVRVTVVR
ncbi:hypothetical protein VFPPC_10906 [Pochonia chlamydosporia 170]|uniref:Uncharacterized protein n=1 Tax=Pochonia chlamydosporia 170 TaxID=1380566 RepID=A0A179EZR6_METCM|nr:hypothetical protein VFPPC_10906 [Pochonia chlamydosporia 170]OAQ58671.1 hypothetical protein VFPPC_10906 [Pochonia chlamydosporia 170]